MTKYTVRQATATGKNDPKFGDEYLVHFNEDDREVKMSRQKPVTAGQEENGTIVDSKYGAYFKKDPYQPQANGTTANVAEKKWTPVKRDNTEGIRVGMCINNAANYVNSLQFDKALTDREWATTVIAYAKALFKISEIHLEEDTVASMLVEE